MNLMTSIGEFLTMAIVGLLVTFPIFLILRSLKWNKIWRRLLRMTKPHWRPIHLQPYVVAAEPQRPEQSGSRRDAN